jgi:hypothetical protein
MQTYHIETVVSKEGMLTIEGLPLHPGEKVEVIIKSQSPSDKNFYPLRGIPIQFKAPFESVAEEEWGISDCS